MRSSYNKIDITYGELLESITKTLCPNKIVEIGILDGYSLESFVKSSSNDTQIFAYDLFDDFNGNHSNKDEMINKFKNANNVTIEYGDFYKLHDLIDNVDILHVDIANNGDVFQYVIDYYLPKMSKNGIVIFEGGSIDRDNVEWMNKYKKPKINDVIQKYIENGYNISIYGNFPSLTVIKV